MNLDSHQKQMIKKLGLRTLLEKTPLRPELMDFGHQVLELAEGDYGFACTVLGEALFRGRLDPTGLLDSLSDSHDYSVKTREETREFLTDIVAPVILMLAIEESNEQE